MFTMKRQQQADTKSQVQDALAAWMAVKNKLSFAPGQPDVYSDKVRMKNLKGLLSGHVHTCLNLAPTSEHSLCQSRVEKGKT